MADSTPQVTKARRAGTAGAVAATALAATALAGPAHADAAQWRQVHGAPEDGGSFTAVAAAGPDAVWAFGDDSAQGPGATRIHRWDGTEWTPEDVPEGATVEPDTADAVGGQVWAAGTTPGGQAVVLHRDGGSWTAPRIDPALHPTDLAAADTDAVWMLSRPVDGYDRAVFFDGEIWRDYPAPSVSQAVAAAGPDAVFAVGSRDDGQPGAERWDGERWSPMEVPEVDLPSGESDAVFTDVLARSADDVVAVGHLFWKDGEDMNHHRPLVGRYDGREWTVETGGEPGSYTAVADAGDGGLWVVDRGWNPVMVHIAADGTTTGQPLSDEKYDLSMAAVDTVPGGGAVAAGTAFEQGDPDVFTDHGFVYGTGSWSAAGE
ncbi:hypothetical protein [Nocardiopsis baichengensis]|uniref:hypothetical protein n=1 Tax=Nocardiopsis baichengensis TaxID=280240 RepID=UPI0003453EC2|nr:hypothetical protein [Nocardiopsis baichengensis]